MGIFAYIGTCRNRIKHTKGKTGEKMRDVDYDVARFDGAVMLLPYTLRDDARRLIKADRANTEEIRLRIGRSPTALIGGEEISLRRDPVTKRELEWTMDILTQASAHTVNESFKAGYITVRGGIPRRHMRDGGIAKRSRDRYEKRLVARDKDIASDNRNSRRARTGDYARRRFQIDAYHISARGR